jgi:hypothetical protein
MLWCTFASVYIKSDQRFAELNGLLQRTIKNGWKLNLSTVLTFFELRWIFIAVWRVAWHWCTCIIFDVWTLMTEGAVRWPGRGWFRSAPCWTFICGVRLLVWHGAIAAGSAATMLVRWAWNRGAVGNSGGASSFWLHLTASAGQHALTPGPAILAVRWRALPASLHKRLTSALGWRLPPLNHDYNFYLYLRCRVLEVGSVSSLQRWLPVLSAQVFSHRSRCLRFLYSENLAVGSSSDDDINFSQGRLAAGIVVPTVVSRAWSADWRILLRGAKRG